MQGKKKSGPRRILLLFQAQLDERIKMKVSILERQFFATRVSATPQDTTESIKRKYIAGEIGGANPIISLESLIKMWLRKIINENEGTPVGYSTSDLLKQALACLALPVTQYETQNWLTFYQNYQP